MKHTIKRNLLTACLLLITSAIWACDIQLQVIGEKQTYAIGDQVKILVDIKLQHRQCDVSINDTKMFCEGIKPLGKIVWVKQPNGHYQCELVVKITKSKTGVSKLVVERLCDRDGGKGTLILKNAYPH